MTGRIPDHSRRILVVMPSWVGDAVMATPALRVLRERFPAAFLGALVRPGVDQVLAGTEFFDELHIDQRAGVMGPKHAAAKVRARRYDTALLLTNSFSTALVARLAFIPRRIGYDRDGRSALLSDRLEPPIRRDTPPFSRSTTDPGAWAPVPACEYYLRLVRALLDDPSIVSGPLELATTPEEESAAGDLLDRAGIDAVNPGPFAILNPGGNDPAKRWPADRFAAVARRLVAGHGLSVYINGSPGEADLVREVAELARHGASAGEQRIVELPRVGVTIGSLKALVRRARLMVTNDTGPRHIAAAFGTPVVSLFGPTDHRWTTIPFQDETILTADPTLPEEEVANDHPGRCQIENITVETVIEAADRLLTRCAAR